VEKPTILHLSQTWCGHNTPLKWMVVHVAQEVGTRKELDAMEHCIHMQDHNTPQYGNITF
jgi:hypothetical protein